MKKILTTVLVLFLATSLTAQFSEHFSFGPRGGFNLTSMTVEGEDINTKMLSGFQIGAVGDYAFEISGEQFAVQLGLLFATQGARWDRGYFGSEGRITLYYLQIPINLQYKLEFGPINLFFQTGPYLGIALFGNEAIRGGTVGNTNNDRIEFGRGDGQTRRFDFGVGVGAGVQFGNFQVGVSYNFGFGDLSNIGERAASRNHGLAFTVAYLFPWNEVRPMISN